MAKTLLRTVYLGGVALAPGTELTDEQAKQITNPKATEDLAIPGQDGRQAEDGDGGEPRRANRDASEGEGQARKAAPVKAQR